MPVVQESNNPPFNPKIAIPLIILHLIYSNYFSLLKLVQLLFHIKS